MQLPPQKITTESFSKLNEISRTLMNDSEELFFDMHRYNRFAKEASRVYQKKILNLEKIINQ